MPFVQMENISHFLRVCQSPPLNLQPHDVFQTVDLYEAKDPAQVLQCIGAFSRRANAVNPARFPRAMGKSKQGIVSPQLTGGSNSGYISGQRGRGTSNASESSTSTYTSPSWGISGRASPTKNGTTSPTAGASTWSKKSDTAATGPAWNNGYNLLTSGYMGGASQGNQGIMFGGRRQITTPAPKVPSLAEKERKRREQEAEDERLRLAAEEAERKRREEREAEEERERIAEERRWEEETKRQREKERREAEEEKRKWEAEERRWKEEEEIRLREEKETEARLEKERQRKRAVSDARLQGQFLSQYQAQQRQLPKSPSSEDPERIAERERMKDLERQLEEAKERERQYERERQERLQAESRNIAPTDKETAPPPKPPPKDQSPPSNGPSDDSWQADERDYLRQQWSDHQSKHPIAVSAPKLNNPPQPPRPLPTPQTKHSSSHRPLPPVSPPSPTPSPPPSLPSRPLPNPQTYTPTPSRTEAYLSSHPPPTPHTPQTHTPATAAHTSTSEADAETARRLASQQKTKAGGWASKSLLEREMERERQRQQEWEESQKQTKEAVEKGVKEGGSGPGESWDVNQYGYTGGDNQNRGAGINFGGRRQILGPRPLGPRPS